MTDVNDPPRGAPAGARAPRRKRAIIAAASGNAIEWFDYSVYGFVAVYIGATFFPAQDPAAQLLSTFAVFGLTFVVRPLGGLFFGPLADRVGRKRVLVIVLVLMSGSTMGVGLLPGYATIGIAAPILLVALRATQNFSVGGEFGSVSSFMVEFSGRARRGFGTSWMNFSAIVGFVFGLILVTILLSILGLETMQDWGWRIPFILAGPLGAIGLYIRYKLEDSPEFEAIRASGDVAKSPLREALAYRRELLTTVGIGALHSSMFYLVLTFMLSHIDATVGLGAGVALAASLAGGFVALIPIPFLGALSDRIGRRPILLIVSVLTVLLAFPAMFLIQSSPAGAIAGQVILGALLGCLLSVSVVTMSEIFPIRVRAAGSSLAYLVATAVFGGAAPFMATFLITATGSTVAPAGLLVFTASLGVMAALILRDRSPAAEKRAPVADKVG